MFYLKWGFRLQITKKLVNHKCFLKLTGYYALLKVRYITIRCIKMIRVLLMNAPRVLVVPFDDPCHVVRELCA